MTERLLFSPPIPARPRARRPSAPAIEHDQLPLAFAEAVEVVARELDPAAWAHEHGLSGPRLNRSELGHPTGLDRPTDALTAPRCHCLRWSITENGDGPRHCIKCGLGFAV